MFVAIWNAFHKLIALQHTTTANTRTYRAERKQAVLSGGKNLFLFVNGSYFREGSGGEVREGGIPRDLRDHPRDCASMKLVCLIMDNPD